MLACKCDICGKLYEGRKYTPDLTINKYRHPYGDTKLDLCNDCQKKLEDWVSTNKSLN